MSSFPALVLVQWDYSLPKVLVFLLGHLGVHPQALHTLLEVKAVSFSLAFPALSTATLESLVGVGAWLIQGLPNQSEEAQVGIWQLLTWNFDLFSWL